MLNNATVTLLKPWIDVKYTIGYSNFICGWQILCNHQELWILSVYMENTYEYAECPFSKWNFYKPFQAQNIGIKMKTIGFHTS